MLRLRPYNANDAEQIMSWSKDEKAFYKWTAGILGNYPIMRGMTATPPGCTACLRNAICHSKDTA